MEKNKKNAISVILHPPRQVVCGYISKYIAGRKSTIATIVILSVCRKVIWRDTLKRMVERSRTGVINVSFHLTKKVIWGDTWKRTTRKTNAKTHNMMFLVLLPLRFSSQIYFFSIKSGEDKIKLTKLNFVSNPMLFIEQSIIYKLKIAISPKLYFPLHLWW